MTDRSTRFVLLLVFLLSGFSGLIYESLWTHYLKLYLGHAAFAQSLVLAIFMGGMALGGFLVSVFAARLRNLLLGYAIAEALIGVYALLFHGLFGLLEAWSFDQVIPGLGSPGAVDAVQWGLTLALLLPPSIVLGATFPLMSGAVIRRFPGANGGNLAALYFSNSFGAACGALVATFVLIDWLGLPGTLTLAGLLNLVIAAVVAMLARVPERPSLQPAPAAATATTTARTDAESNPALPRLFFLAAFVTGAASFIYEVGWIRMLSLVLGSSFHAFELMLSAFIAGLALGSLAIRSRIDRIADPLAAAAWIQVAMGVLAVATLPVYAQSFDWMARLVKALPHTDQGWLLYNLASHGIAFAVMLPATVLAGMTLPLFTHVLLRAGHGERSIGRIYAANSLGAIAGVLLAIHLGLPLLGLKLTLALGAMFDILLGLLLLRAAAAPTGRRLAAFATLAVPMLVVRLVTLDPAMLGSGVFRTGNAHPEVSRTLFYRDGKTATISVAEYNGSVGTISTNGKPDAAIEFNPRNPPGKDEVTMVLLGALPLALKPDAQHVANIGFGSGLTTHVVLGSPAVKTVSTIEIEPAVIDASRAFGPRVARAYDDPRSQLQVEDAKSWFARQNRRFDLIISEPSNPWVSGVASLFSDEFYHRIKRHLADGGLLVQWLHLYEFDLRLAASVIKALDSHFKDYVIYDIDGSNLMIVASADQAVPAAGDAIFAMPGLQSDLQRVGVRTLSDLNYRWIGAKADLGRMMQAVRAPANSDYRPFVELNAPRSRFLRLNALEVNSVNLATLPVVEMLARPHVRWQAQAVTPGGIPRHQLTAVALDIRGNLLGSPQGPDRVRDGVMQARDRLRTCADMASAPGLGELHALAMATLAHLDPAALQALWLQPAWLPCPAAQWPAAAARRMALYQAVARRDAATMRSTALAALSEPQDDPDWQRYVLQAAVLAHRAQGDEAGLQALWQRHGPTLYGNRPLSPEMLLLLAPR